MQTSNVEYVIIWEYAVSVDMAEQFEAVYGATGGWAEFFHSAPGFRGTRLLRDADDPLRYTTLDFWDSAEAYHRFKKNNLEEYETFDADCAELAESETYVGSFIRNAQK